MPILLFFVLVAFVLIAISFLVIALAYVVVYGALLAAAGGTIYLFILLGQWSVERVQHRRHRRDLARRAPARQAWLAFQAALDPLEAHAFAHGQQDNELLDQAVPARELMLIRRAQVSNNAGMMLIGELATMADTTALHSRGWGRGPSGASLPEVLKNRTQLLRELTAAQPLSVPHPALTSLVHAPLWHVLTRLGSELTRRSPDSLELQLQQHLARELWSREAAA